MSVETPAVILVCGNSRSGTTMLARVLGRNEAALFLPETRYFQEVSDIATFGDPLSSEDSDRMGRELSRRAHGYFSTEHYSYPAAPTEADAGALFEHVVRHVRDVAPGTALIEQTPANLFSAGILLDHSPNWRAVVIERGAHDVIASQKRRWRRRKLLDGALPRSEAFRSWSTNHVIVQALLWRRGVSQRQELLARHPNVAFLRYEDLCADPEGEVKRISSELGLEYSPSMLDVQVAGSSYAADSDRTGITSSSVGTWAKTLTGDEAAVIDLMCAEALVDGDYSPSGRPLRPTAALLLLTFPKVLAGTLMTVGRLRGFRSNVMLRLGRQ